MYWFCICSDFFPFFSSFFAVYILSLWKGAECPKMSTIISVTRELVEFMKDGIRSGLGLHNMKMISNGWRQSKEFVLWSKQYTSDLDPAVYSPSAKQLY